MTATRQINVTLGTAGHIDHGKTALIRLLTGCETDRLKEEKARGLTIDLGYAPCTIADIEVGIVDVPGHEGFVKTMVAGAAGMDGCILVVAADDGVMPQTREHLDILTLLGVRHGIVALTKIDRVSADRRVEAEASVRQFISGTFLADAPILPMSSITGEGFMEFFGALKALVKSIEPKSLEGVFRMPVDRTFTAKGIGTVVAGIPVSGSARAGDTVVLLPQGIESSIRGIQVYGRNAEAVKAGQCAALQMRHWDREAIVRGNTVARPGYFQSATWAAGTLRLLSVDGARLKNGATVKLHTGTSEQAVRVYLMAGDAMQPGEEGLAQFHADAPLVVAPGDRFILRSVSPVMTVGGGVFLETQTHRLRRTKPGVVERLNRLAEAAGSPQSLMAFAARDAGVIVTPERLCRAAVVTPPQGETLIEALTESGELWRMGATRLLHRDVAQAALDAVNSALEAHHRNAPESPGLTFDELLDATGLERSLLDALVKRALDRNELAEAKGRLALAGHTSAFSEADRKDIEAIEALYRDAAFKPPSVEDAAQQASVEAGRARRLVELLVEHQRLVRLDPKIAMHRDAVQLARQRIEAHIVEKGKLESVDFKYLIDTTRKFALPLLDYLDTIGVTRRVGNTRFLKRT